MNKDEKLSSKELPFAIKKVQTEQHRICQEFNILEKKLDGVDIFVTIDCEAGVKFGYARVGERAGAPAWGFYVDCGERPLPVLMAPADLKLIAFANLGKLLKNIELSADQLLGRKVEQPSLLVVE